MASELRALEENPTWTLEPLPLGNDLSQVSYFKSVISTHFKTKDFGPLKYFLGPEVARSPLSIFLNQQKYALPMEQNLKLNDTDGDLLPNLAPYRRLVGHLIYLTITKPDIIFAALQAKAFSFLPLIHVSAYTDFDWASYPTTRHSTTGFFILLGSSPIF
ncbi:hypothetical protein F2P56_002056 [Juglans regia]|uniref:Reverse transcriptase Ty1/copia-type domain-containing protein n=1 Tax=Juglans regia TaxID=51240 RepID=A0A833Y823_JUGRE|nr:hypothetical protein F2P56_002056 [Juglans regia]